MEKCGTGYYEFQPELEKLMFQNGVIDEVFYLKDLSQRKLYIDTDITQEAIWDTKRHIMQFNREDVGIKLEERKPILLYVTSNGGDVDAGFEIIDIILSSKTPVYTVNLGYQYSMGFMIGLAGHKRFASPHAKFLMHDGSGVVMDSLTKLQDFMEFQKKTRERSKAYILSRSKLTSEEYDDRLRMEWYMFADEAKEKGFTDYILGVDCDIDAIV